MNVDIAVFFLPAGSREIIMIRWCGGQSRAEEGTGELSHVGVSCGLLSN
jgi:hypothetical protein